MKYETLSPEGQVTSAVHVVHAAQIARDAPVARGRPNRNKYRPKMIIQRSGMRSRLGKRGNFHQSIYTNGMIFLVENVGLII